jgi:hypothetical protein
MRSARQHGCVSGKIRGRVHHTTVYTLCSSLRSAAAVCVRHPPDTRRTPGRRPGTRYSQSVCTRVHTVVYNTIIVYIYKPHVHCSYFLHDDAHLILYYDYNRVNTI